MRYLMVLVVFLVSCGETAKPPTMPEKIDNLTWVSGDRGTFNNNFNFYLFEYAAPSLESAQCPAEFESGARARDFMVLLTQDLSTIKIESVHEANLRGEYGVTLSQEGHDLGVLGVSWGHLKPRLTDDALSVDWCKGVMAE
ncbi:hypothetical protein [Fretibacter rubidus]|uniref:hypothetical protein n=1 Tax=Fretibacter rubidus TaxID=570162 RepID=UPI00352B195D